MFLFLFCGLEENYPMRAFDKKMFLLKTGEDGFSLTRNVAEVSTMHEPQGSAHGERANFSGIVIGFIEADFSRTS